MHPSVDWHALGAELRSVSLLHVAIAVAATHAGIALRAWRWKSLMPAEAAQTHATELIAPQFTGFAAVALFGRIADLARPTLIARRTRTRVATQIAVYSMERIFDLLSAAVVFSVGLAMAPRGSLHHSALVHAGVVSIVATFILVCVAGAIAIFGDHVADFAGHLMAGVAPRLAPLARTRIVELQVGFARVQGIRALVSALAISLAIWTLIAAVYIETLHAFTATPALAVVTVSGSMLLLATSLGSSLLQLPGLGWLTQIAATAAAMIALYRAPAATSTACAALLLFNTTLCIVPAGLIAARRAGISLSAASRSTPR